MNCKIFLEKFVHYKINFSAKKMGAVRERLFGHFILC